MSPQECAMVVADMAAETGWVLLMQYRPAKVGVCGWWRAKLSLQVIAYTLLIFHAYFILLYLPGTITAVQRKMQPCNFISQGHRKGIAKPIDSGLDRPMEEAGALERKDLQVWWGSKEHMLGFLLRGETKNLNLSHTTGDGCHPRSGCLPSRFIEQKPSVCHGDLWGQQIGKHLRDAGLLLKAGKCWWCFTNRRSCWLFIISPRYPNPKKFPFSLSGKIIIPIREDHHTTWSTGCPKI